MMLPKIITWGVLGRTWGVLLGLVMPKACKRSRKTSFTVSAISFLPNALLHIAVVSIMTETQIRREGVDG